jgi:hypothetical protein
MSIEIEATFINKASDIDGLQIDPEKFRHLSKLVQDLLEIQIVNSKDRDKLKFFAKNHKFLVTYHESNDQDDFDENSIEQELVKGLEKTINTAQQYYDLTVKEGVGRAKDYNLKNGELPAKVLGILSKLEEDDIKLVTGITSVKLPKIRKIDIKNNTYKHTFLDGARITKPELIGPMVAEFWGAVDKKKIIARLVVPPEYEKLVCEMAFLKKKVDIEFEYSENLKKSNRYIGTLTSIKVSKIIDTNTELDF